MIKMNSVSGILCFVSDLEQTVGFYKKLGFLFNERTSADSATARLNWFWIEFVAKDKAEQSVFQKENDIDKSQLNGAGMFVHISVQNVDEFHEASMAKGLKPSCEPKDFPWGRREFIIRDPDGYKLVFFSEV